MSDEERNQRDEMVEDSAEDLQIDDKAADDVKGGDTLVPVTQTNLTVRKAGGKPPVEYLKP